MMELSASSFGKPSMFGKPGYWLLSFGIKAVGSFQNPAGNTVFLLCNNSLLFLSFWSLLAFSFLQNSMMELSACSFDKPRILGNPGYRLRSFGTAGFNSFSFLLFFFI